MVKSFIEEKILSWLERLGSDEFLEFRNNALFGGVQIRMSNRGKVVCKLVASEEIHRAYCDVLVEAVERGLGRLGL